MPSYLDPEELPSDLQQILAAVQQATQVRSGDCLSLIQLLRLLEELHRTIYEGAFHEALPNTRKSLHDLLRDLEAEGYWPYIHRLQIRALLENLAPSSLNPGIVDWDRVESTGNDQ